MGSSTSKKSLYKPVSGEKGWAASVNGNMDKLDDFYLVQGAHVVSESALFTTAGYPTDGHRFDVTGTTTITSMLTSGRVGQVIILQFDGTLIITHHATDLILANGRNITTQAGDRFVFREYAAGDWELIDSTLSGSIIQIVNVTDGVLATGATQLPLDNTIPQITEGDEYMTLAITPTSATNKLIIEVVWVGASSVGNNTMSTALFQDTTANALAVTTSNTANVVNSIVTIPLTYYMTAGTTSATTFRIRAGGGLAGTTTFNGHNATQDFGGVMASSITITEVKA